MRYSTASVVNATDLTIQGPHPWFDIRAYGAKCDSVTDDTAAIQAAVTAATNAGAGVIYCPAVNGNWIVVNGTITLTDVENVRFIGDTAPNHVYQGAPNLGTCFRRVSGTGIMLDWKASTAAQSLRGCGIENIVFDGSNLCTTVVRLTSIYGGRFVNIHIREGTTAGLALTTADLTGTEDLQKNKFENISVRCAQTAGAKGITLGSWGAGGGNVSLNVFENIIVYTQNGTGIECGDSDTNTFLGVECNRSGTAIGIDLLGHVSSATTGNARHNVFLHVDAPGGITSRATSYTANPAKTNYVLLSRGNSTPSPTIEAGSTITVQDTTGRSINVLSQYRAELVMKDDFATGGTGGGTVGELGWTQTNGTLSVPSASAGHPGVVNVSTGAASSTVAGMSNSTNGSAAFSASDTFDATFVVRVNTNDSDTQLRVGVNGSATGDPAANGIYFEKLYADTQWFGVTRFGGSQTRSSALANVSTNWVTLRVRRIDGTSIGFTVDGGTEVLQSTNVPTAVSVEALLQVKNQTNTAKTVDFDYFECRIGGLSRT